MGVSGSCHLYKSLFSIISRQCYESISLDKASAKDAWKRLLGGKKITGRMGGLAEREKKTAL